MTDFKEGLPNLIFKINRISINRLLWEKKGEIPFLTAIDLKILDQEGSYKTMSSLYSHLERIYSQFLSPTVCLPYIFINVRNIVSLEISVKKHRSYPWIGRKRMKSLCKRTMATLWGIFKCRKKNQQIFNSRSFPVCVLSPTLCDPLDYSLPGSSVHEILQARILE